MAAVPRRFPRLARREIFAGAAEVTGRSPGRQSWSDDDLNGFKSIRLTVLSDVEMIRECKIFLYGMSTNMSARSIASALILTWNMRSADPVEERIFPRSNPGDGPDDLAPVSFEEPDQVYTSPTIDTMLENKTAFEVRRSCAFLAASTLKMFAKGASSWTTAWEKDHFSKRYEGFTKKVFPLRDLIPLKENVDTMYEAYQGQKIYIGTLGRILYSLAEVADSRMTDMLFEQHLACTGLHIIPQFINAKLATGATTSDLLSALYYGQNEATLVQLKTIIDTSLSKPIDTENRGTWRFARLFDPNAFPLLQTKYAQETVAVLASINYLAKENTTTSNPLNIAVIKQMGRESKRRAMAVAHNIYHNFVVVERAIVNEFFDTDTYNLPEEEREEGEEEEA